MKRERLYIRTHRDFICEYVPPIQMYIDWERLRERERERGK